MTVAAPAVRLLDAVAAPVGQILGAVFCLVGRARGRGRRALHPTGQVLPGVVDRNGSSVSTGARWLDEAGADEVVVRRSRATGLPDALPDVLGLGLRVPLDDGGHGDLLLASTGLGRFSRYLLRPARRSVPGYTSVFPYRAARGPVVLAAIPVGEHPTTFDLAWARPTGPWQRFGRLRLGEPDPATDSALPFEPVRRALPGLPSYRWAAELRRPSYAGSRRARGV